MEAGGETWTCTATRVCNNNKAHTETETVIAEYSITKPSTYKEDGVGTYSAVFENPGFSTQTKEIPIPAITCDGGEDCPSARFTDIPGAEDWTHLPIDWAVTNKITLGTSETTFSPKENCTRGQFVTLLWRTMGSPEPETTDNPFKDVREGQYYYKAILWAYEKEISSGTSKTTFSPEASCSRAQVVTFLWRMEGSQEPSSTENPFADVPSDSYYWKPVLWAYEKGITSGTSATAFSPNKSCNRAEAITFLYREFAD